MENRNIYNNFNDNNVVQTKMNNIKNVKIFKTNSQNIKPHNRKNLFNNIQNEMLKSENFSDNIPNFIINEEDNFQNKNILPLSKSLEKKNYINNINGVNNINNMFRYDIRMNYCLEMLGLEDLKFNFNKNRITFEQILYLSRKDMEKMKIPIEAQTIFKQFSLDYLKIANSYTLEELHIFFMKNNYKQQNNKKNNGNKIVNWFNHFKNTYKKGNNPTHNLSNKNKMSRSLKNTLIKKDTGVLSKMNLNKNKNAKILEFNKYYSNINHHNIYNGEQNNLFPIDKHIVNGNKIKRNCFLNFNKNNLSPYKEYVSDMDKFGLNLNSIENDLKMNNFIITQNLDYLSKNNQRLLNSNNKTFYKK